MTTADGSKVQKVLVVGAGPVGALAALYAANRGDDVHVYELRAGMILFLPLEDAKIRQAPGVPYMFLCLKKVMPCSTTDENVELQQETYDHT